MRTIIPETIRAEAVARYIAGDRPKNIAADLGLNYWNISVIVRRAGCARRRSEAQQLILSRSEWIGNRQYPVRDDAFSVITPESAYWIGFLMADGCIRGNKIRLKLATRDLAHLEKFQAFVGTAAPITINAESASGQIKGRTIRSSGSAQITVASEQGARDLALFGVIPRKSLIAKVNQLETNRDFWRGAVDGNGSVFVSGGTPHLALVGSHTLMGQFLAFCKTITKTNVTAGPAGNISRVHMSCGPAVAVISALYNGASISLDRKAMKADAIVGDR